MRCSGLGVCRRLPACFGWLFRILSPLTDYLASWLPCIRNRYFPFFVVVNACTVDGGVDATSHGPTPSPRADCPKRKHPGSSATNFPLRPICRQLAGFEKVHPEALRQAVLRGWVWVGFARPASGDGIVVLGEHGAAKSMPSSLLVSLGMSCTRL